LKKVFFSFHIPQILGGKREEAKPGTYKTTLRTTKKTENENKDKQEKKNSKKAPPGNLQALIKLPIIDDTYRALPLLRKRLVKQTRSWRSQMKQTFLFSVSDPRHTEREDILTNSNTDRRSDSSDGREGQRTRGSGYVFSPVPPLKKTNKHCAK
jgi:hypothetical protein